LKSGDVVALFAKVVFAKYVRFSVSFYSLFTIPRFFFCLVILFLLIVSGCLTNIPVYSVRLISSVFFRGILTFTCHVGSEQMSLVQLIVPTEVAHDTVAELGELGDVQFKDVRCNGSAR